MKKINIFYKAIALVIVLASLLSVFVACKEKKPDENNPTDGEQKELLDISGYSIVRYSNAKKNVTKKTTDLKKSIKETLGIDLKVGEDWYNPNNPPDLNAKEILIDRTNRKESQDALAKLNESDKKNIFIIDITENKIVIVGKTNHATLRGIAYFMNNYVMNSPKGNSLDVTHGKNVVRDFTVLKNISIDGKFDMDVEVLSTVLASSDKVSNALGHSSIINDTHFPAIIELQHQPNEENNGILIGAFSYSEEKSQKPVNSMACIMESRDEGNTWKLLARPEETKEPQTGWAGSMGHIYELPEQVGKMPAGTLIYSSNAVNYDKSSHIGVWRSDNCGKTWREISIVAKGGGTAEGVWEPYMICDGGYLYCFYSDDSNDKYDQRIVYRRTQNGVTWEAPVEVCAFGEFADRPGMPVVTKMGNGEFFLVYEYVLAGQPSTVYYKTTKDITSWNPQNPGKIVQARSGNRTFFAASGPSCVWTPAGGDCGTLFVTGQYQGGGVPQNSVFVSLDYGKTWDIIPNPLPYDNYVDFVENYWCGYRALMVVGADPSVIHYINATSVKLTGKAQIEYAKLKVYD